MEARLTEKMKEGLARMYADEGCRSYLMVEITHMNDNMIKTLDAGKLEEAQRYSNRMKAFQDLLSRGQEYFKHFEKLRVERAELQGKHDDDEE